MAKRTPQPQQLELALPLHESMRLREELTRTQQALATTREELADVRAEAEQWAAEAIERAQGSGARQPRTA